MNRAIPQRRIAACCCLSSFQDCRISSPSSACRRCDSIQAFLFTVGSQFESFGSLFESDSPFDRGLSRFTNEPCSIFLYSSAAAVRSGGRLELMGQAVKAGDVPHTIHSAELSGQSNIRYLNMFAYFVYIFYYYYRRRFKYPRRPLIIHP